MQTPAFSVCIPNYNYAKYIGETIQSVLNQTYPHYEIIVVDNASTDDSVAVVKGFHSDRIRLYQNPYNVGFAPNLDRAASKATNPYIIVLSSDDLMRPTALQEYAEIIQALGEDAESALIVSSIEVIDSQGKLIERKDRRSYYDIEPYARGVAGRWAGDVELFSGLKVFRAVFPRMSVPGHFCTTLYSRELYDRIGGYSSVNHIGPDAHFAYKALLQDVNVVFVNRPLFAYRVHNTNQLTNNQKAATIKIPIDRYLFTLQYTDQELAKSGTPRQELIRFLIDESCMMDGLRELLAGRHLQAFRLLMFAFASYPGFAIRNLKTYVLLALLLCGPAGPPLARLVHTLNVRRLDNVPENAVNRA